MSTPDSPQSVLRHDYAGEGLGEDRLADTPWEQLERWVAEADERARSADDVYEPRAMSIATVDATGAPNVRTVLLRFLDPRGPGFVSSSDSTKGVELGGDPRVAANLVWPAMFRAVRLRGVVERIDEDEVAAYWSSRPYGSRISAWASHQSAPVAGRAELEERVAELERLYPDHGHPDDVPVPPTWWGYRVRAHEVEFWAGRPSRLHDRLVFTAVGSGGGAAAQDVDLHPALDDPAAWLVGRRQP